jgi:hypothetical protein
MKDEMEGREEGKRTHPLAIAPTNTAIECVSGSVGRNWDNRIVGASADRAVCQLGDRDLGEARWADGQYAEKDMKRWGRGRADG